MAAAADLLASRTLPIWSGELVRRGIELPTPVRVPGRSSADPESTYTISPAVTATTTSTQPADEPEPQALLHDF